MQNIINKYRRYNWVATTFVVMLHVTETIPCQATHHKSFIYLLHLPVYWGGTIIWVMICLHLTYHVSKYMPLFSLLPKHLLLHTATVL